MRKRAPRYVGPFEPLGDERCEYGTGDDNLERLAARLTMYSGSSSRCTSRRS